VAPDVSIFDIDEAAVERLLVVALAMQVGACATTPR